MADTEKDEDLVIKAELLEKAEQAKKRKFTWRGLSLSLIGIICVLIGILINTGPASWEGFFVAVGVIFLIAGILSLLIGVINPFFADAMRQSRKPPHPPEAEEIEQS